MHHNAFFFSLSTVQYTCIIVLFYSEIIFALVELTSAVVEMILFVSLWIERTSIITGFFIHSVQRFIQRLCKVTTEKCSRSLHYLKEHVFRLEQNMSELTLGSNRSANAFVMNDSCSTRLTLQDIMCLQLAVGVQPAIQPFFYYLPFVTWQLPF